MLRGVYSRTGAAATSHAPGGRLRELAAGELLADGPFAAAAGGGVATATRDGVTCLLVGRLLDPAALAADLGVAAGADAELVARAYARLGNELPARLRGRFAFVAWDRRRGRGLLASDPLASRPLFFGAGPGWLAFADELVDLLAILPATPGPDPVGFVSWLGGWTVPTDRTLYEGVARLAPGHCLELGGDPRPRRFWRPEFRGTRSGSPGELALELRERVEAAIARRAAGESAAVVLSGGLDSSIVTALAAAARPAGDGVRTYSAVFPGADYDERWKVEELTAALGVEAETFTVEPRGSLWLNLAHLKRWGQPLLGSAALIDLAMTAAAAGDGAGAVLDGQTGDEVFGCSPWLVADRLAAGRLPGALALARDWPGRPTNGREQRHILKHWGLKGAMPYALHGHRRRRGDRLGVTPTWLLPEVRQAVTELRDEWAWKRSGSGPRWWRYLSDLLVEAPHRELRLDYLRNRAAALGVGGEAPLYDLDLIEFTLTIPPRLGFDVAGDRPLVREAVRGLVPDGVRLQNRKANFSPFCFEMLAGADGPGIDRLLGAPDAELGAYADLGRVRELWREGRPGADGAGATTAWGTDVWRLAAAECWLRSLADGDFVDRALAGGEVPAPVVRRAGSGEDLALFSNPPSLAL